LVSAINRVPAESVVLLPNNKNVLFAAQQAVELAGKPVKVVPTRTIPQGISAAMAFDLDASLDENYDRMKDAADMVATGEFTYAVRSTKTGNLDINEKDIIGLADGEIRVAARSIDEVGIELLKLLVDEDKEIISIYYGEQINADEANAFLSKVEETFPDLEVELHDGGQPLYYYVFGVE
jgi:dihydroxyacetone kinase-like predicted kinase